MGGNSQVVLRGGISAAGKDKGLSRKLTLTQGLSERTTDHRRILICPFCGGECDFQIQHRKHSPQPTLPCLSAYQDEAWGMRRHLFDVNLQSKQMQHNLQAHIPIETLKFLSWHFRDLPQYFAFSLERIER